MLRDVRIPLRLRCRRLLRHALAVVDNPLRASTPRVYDPRALCWRRRHWVRLAVVLAHSLVSQFQKTPTTYDLVVKPLQTFIYKGSNRNGYGDGARAA